MIKYTQTIPRLFPTICLSMFDYFVGLALKGLSKLAKTVISSFLIFLEFNSWRFVISFQVNLSFLYSPSQEYRKHWSKMEALV